MNLTILNQFERQPQDSASHDVFNSRASRDSLTVHSPRWSPQTPARDLQPNGDSATGENAQPGGEDRSKKENLELLKAIMTSKIFAQFESAFTAATGLPVALLPVESLQLSFHGARKEGPFCALMAGENRTCGACLTVQAQIAKDAMKGPHTTVCYAGLSETVVPLRLGNRLIGFLRSGQVFRRRPTPRRFQRTLKLLTSWGVNLERDVLQEAYFGTRVVKPQQHAAAVKLLSIFVEHLAMLSNEILIQHDNAEPPMITKVKAFIREHHAEELNLPLVARFAHTSTYNFCRLFKRATRLTFTQFLTRVRIESCKRLLTNPHLRVSEVAFEVGFQSLTHFNRVFQKILGQSPTEYRRKIQNRGKSA
jgi:AraC-like DNA-binding protein/ligand-binding sensor protein